MDTGNTTEHTSPGARLRVALRAELRRAMVSRDPLAVSACRSALGAIDNAEAVPVAEGREASALEASPVGVGATEVARRVLGESEVLVVVQAEIDERRAAAEEVEGFDPGRAEQLRQEAEVLVRQLP